MQGEKTVRRPAKAATMGHGLAGYPTRHRRASTVCVWFRKARRDSARELGNQGVDADQAKEGQIGEPYSPSVGACIKLMALAIDHQITDFRAGQSGPLWAGRRALSITGGSSPIRRTPTQASRALRQRYRYHRHHFPVSNRTSPCTATIDALDWYLDPRLGQSRNLPRQDSR